MDAIVASPANSAIPKLQQKQSTNNNLKVNKTALRRSIERYHEEKELRDKLDLDYEFDDI